ncbi:DUF3750 domain-containing protein [Salinimonas marina]|uniref:DUF3750 domain-containing protein n=1 Tax=Salinimonas marina TaxID=2785918 RepID=A0A7S9DX00_9ALTE|nr:DUF3750 domain-containing protein [Salinimonas marina]QPG05253.1 DUF3750 domain-containing protein [Salinimonas marina]
MKSVFLMFFSILMLTSCAGQDWRTASREPAGIAADPATKPAAIIDVYVADAFSWRGWFAVHTWVAVKPQNASEYTVYEVVGWRIEEGLPALKQYQTSTPDRYWYGARPERILSLEGDKASALIADIEQAADSYPWADQYQVFPGPNSNTFPAWLAKQIPELGLELPFRAIGSGYADKADEEG